MSRWSKTTHYVKSAYDKPPRKRNVFVRGEKPGSSDQKVIQRWSSDLDQRLVVAKVSQNVFWTE